MVSFWKQAENLQSFAIGANWRQLAPIKLRKTNFWLVHIANWRYRQLAPIIGANWRHGGANKRQLAPIIGANWRHRQLAMCSWVKNSMTIAIGAKLAPTWFSSRGANWRQLAPIGDAQFCEKPTNYRHWRQLAPIGATTADFIVWRCSLVAVCIAWLWVWMYYCNNGWCGFVTMFPLLSLGL